MLTLRPSGGRHLLVACAVVTAATSCASSATSATSATSAAAATSTHHCAVLPDSVGLYVGNPVTQMGYKIGTIDDIKPGPQSVRVDFTLNQKRTLPGDVKAVVRSTSILADRALELVGNYDGGATLSSAECVPLERASTPKSLSEIIGSANTFLEGINPQTSSNIGDVIKQLDQAAQHNGAGINRILTTSSRMLDSPDAAISDMSSIVTNLGLVTDTLVQVRDPMKQILNDAVTTTPTLVDAIAGARDMA